MTICIMLFRPDGSFIKGREVRITGVWDSQQHRRRLADHVLTHVIGALGHAPHGTFMVTSESSETGFDLSTGEEYKFPPFLFRF